MRGRKVGLILCGGNIDPRILASIMVRELERADRIVSFRLTIPDRPGVLGQIASRLGELGANILGVDHHRLFLDVPAKGAKLDVTMETRDAAHAEEIFRVLGRRLPAGANGGRRGVGVTCANDRRAPVRRARRARRGRRPRLVPQAGVVTVGRRIDDGTGGRSGSVRRALPRQRRDGRRLQHGNFVGAPARQRDRAGNRLAGSQILGRGIARRRWLLRGKLATGAVIHAEVGGRIGVRIRPGITVIGCRRDGAALAAASGVAADGGGGAIGGVAGAGAAETGAAIGAAGAAAIGWIAGGGGAVAICGAAAGAATSGAAA